MRGKRSRPTEETTTSMSAPPLRSRTTSTSLRPALSQLARPERSRGTGTNAPASAGSLRFT